MKTYYVAGLVEEDQATFVNYFLQDKNEFINGLLPTTDLEGKQHLAPLNADEAYHFIGGRASLLETFKTYANVEISSAIGAPLSLVLRVGIKLQKGKLAARFKRWKERKKTSVDQQTKDYDEFRSKTITCLSIIENRYLIMVKQGETAKTTIMQNNEKSTYKLGNLYTFLAQMMLQLERNITNEVNDTIEKLW